MAETNADLLLDETYNNETVLNINVESRTIETNGDILLGVENDYKANKIFFLSPKTVGNDIDLSLSTVEIFVSFKNASNELYISTCTKETYSDSNFVLFSWLLTKEVTKTNGKVNFIVCAKNVVDSTLCNEWHTSIATGIVLKGITENDKSLIIDTDPASSVHQLKDLVQNALDHVGDVNGYSKTEVDNKFSLFENSLETDMIKYTNSPTQETEYLTGALNDIYSKVKLNSEGLTTTNNTLKNLEDNLTAEITETNTNLESKLDKPYDNEGSSGKLLMSLGPNIKPMWQDQRWIQAGSLKPCYTEHYLTRGTDESNPNYNIHFSRDLLEFWIRDTLQDTFSEINILIIGNNIHDGNEQTSAAKVVFFDGKESVHIDGTDKYGNELKNLYIEIRIRRCNIKDLIISEGITDDGTYDNIFTYEIITNGNVSSNSAQSQNFGIGQNLENVTLYHWNFVRSNDSYFFNLIKLYP